ncbi:AMP-binding protein [Synechococcus sp. PCC 7336]|uniref:AMP-binding protein n=1 Tax=Synechococcus sp. PCC 7336 TaxID=195250 RepID=UPI000476C0DD|nr:AMP-binding protein [Synechococcus sp. PCC 7336]
MAIDLLSLLQQRSGGVWLASGGGDRFEQLFWKSRKELQTRSGQEESIRIALAERDSDRFLARFAAAHTSNCQVFLCNPGWGDREWSQMQEIVQPHWIWGECQLEVAIESRAVGTDLPGNAIAIPTGGTSGQLKFAMHTWSGLSSAAIGFQQHFGVSQVNSVCTLPLFHVSGLMQFVRSLLTGGQLAIASSSDFLGGNCLDLDPEGWFISLVPTQLQRSLSHPDLVRWLSRCRAVLLGGAPAWPQLLSRARSLNLPLAPTYGTTETAAQVATLKPADFLAGQQGCAQILPHVQLSILDEDDRPLPPNRPGRIAIASPCLALGYYPDRFQPDRLWSPQDIGYLDGDGYLHVLGRSSDTILSGGENVYPLEVEAALRATGRVRDVAVTGVADAEWGEAIAAICVLADRTADWHSLKMALDGQLAHYKHPRRWLAVAELPRNNRGKLDRRQLQALARNARPL